MIPIKLAIQGLYSYQDLQEIDFQRLIGSSVFGIFGKVGSGKTSLLEAISFALYGETERLHSRDNRLYNMMNLKSKYLKIDFEFRAGADQQLYKFIYEAKRHPKKHHEIGPGERRTFIWQENDWHPIGNEKEDVSILSKQIIGLDYSNFKRTIIIPQNQFREFLELSPTDRTKMMNQLFKLEQYDLAGYVKKLSKINDDQLAELRGLLAPLEAVTPEAIEQAETEIETLKVYIREKDTLIEQFEPQERRLIYSQKKAETLLETRQELAKWLTREAHYQQIEQTVRHYEQCQLVFQSDFENLGKRQTKQEALSRNEQEVQYQLDSVIQQLPAIQAAYDAAKTAYENREQIQKQIDELRDVEIIRGSQDTLARLNQQQRATNTALDRQKEHISKRKLNINQYQLTIDRLVGEESDLERLYKVQNWFTAYTPLKKQADSLQDQIAKYDAKVEQLKHQKGDALTDFPAVWAAYTLKTLPAHIDQELAQLKASQQTCETTYQQTLLKHELQRYAESLTEGVACPLCGSEHHPVVHNDIDAAKAALQQSENAVNAIRQQIEETTTLRLTINSLETELRAALENGKRLIDERAVVVRQLIDHEDAFIWPEFTKEQEDAVAGAIQRENSYKKQLSEAQEAVRELLRQLEADETELSRLREQAAKADTDVAGISGQIQSLTESLTFYTLPEISQLDLKQIDNLRTSLADRHRQTKTNFDQADKRRNDLEKEQVGLQEQVQQLIKQQTEVVAEIVDLEKVITKNLTKKGLMRGQVEQILGSNLDVDAEKQRISEYHEKRLGLTNQLLDLEKELAENPFDPVALDTVQNQLRTLRDQKDDLNKAFGQCTNILATLKRQWTEKQAHQQRHDDLDLRRQDLKKMDELFRAQGFVNYVSSVYLKNLCESANDRFFKLTNNQLKLELDEKNNFQVRDFINGGEVRSVKTLSGGQTFQAALSLALALSDNIQHLTKAKQNLFFLDEGFGTLDKDSLQTVFKTLKALRSENRVVGVISHVEELQQEVDTYIRAEASENGSRIVRSWDE
ncbi:AAA family ATPase [Spirosoma areae]